MPDLTDKPKLADPLKQELEGAAFSPPDWALDHAHCGNSGEADAKTIPQFFIDAILEVIAKTIEQVLAEVVSRFVGESVEKKIIPLTEQIALLRIVIEHVRDEINRRKQEQDADAKKIADEEKESQL